MSPQRLLEQRRAEWAWQAAMAAKEKGEDYADSYGQAARGATADILMSGLGQTLAFWRARGKNKSEWYNLLYTHLSAWLSSGPEPISTGDLLEWIRSTASPDDYRRATAEAMAALIWLKRFAEAELIKHEPSQ